MANHIWTGGAGTGVWSTAGNWSGGVPIAGGDVYITDTDKTITTVPDDSAELAYASLHIGGKFSGVLASSGAPLYLGSITGIVEIDAPLARSLFMAAGTTRTIPQVAVKRTSGNPDSLVLSGPGTWSVVSCAGGYTRLATGAVVTKVEGSSNAIIEIEPNCTIGAVDQAGGVIENESAITGDVNCGGGTFNHKGDSYFNIGGVLRGLGGTFIWGANGGTIASCLWALGLLNLNAGFGSPVRTFTAFRQTGGKVDKSGVGSNVIYTASTYVAGDIQA